MPSSDKNNKLAESQRIANSVNKEYTKLLANNHILNTLLGSPTLVPHDLVEFLQGIGWTKTELHGFYTDAALPYMKEHSKFSDRNFYYIQKYLAKQAQFLMYHVDIMELLHYHNFDVASFCHDDDYVFNPWIKLSRDSYFFQAFKSNPKSRNILYMTDLYLRINKTDYTSFTIDLCGLFIEE